MAAKLFQVELPPVQCNGCVYGGVVVVQRQGIHFSTTISAASRTAATVLSTMNAWYFLKVGYGEQMDKQEH